MLLQWYIQWLRQTNTFLRQSESKFSFTFFMWRVMKELSQYSSRLKIKASPQDLLSLDSPVGILFQHPLMYLQSDCNCFHSILMFAPWPTPLDRWCYTWGSPFLDFWDMNALNFKIYNSLKYFRIFPFCYN